MQVTHAARWSTHFPKKLVRAKNKRAKEKEKKHRRTRLPDECSSFCCSTLADLFIRLERDEKLLRQLPAVVAQIAWNALPFVDLPIVLNFWYLPSAPITSNRCNPMDPSV